ncbi:GntR family transcriptional regulator [Paenibacillus sp. MWE-103]|uniref:GntR family transcriptional regulator n=1 Tax=Paenibacillus artemisiicola TaxID=1172618 RepID=A0ABS3WKD5_9BACL|nr:GntR family transcriptional regulator [Paenibacillus artemisiicola]MBO7748789.1 GntR family transcriptional regulator [Paenibacillus artemisiicola]
MYMDRKPLYIRIQSHFKEAIRAGQLREGDRIPAEKELLEHFNVSRITVANALGELARDGWIYRVPGRGTFVRGVPEDETGYAAAAAETAGDDFGLGALGAAKGTAGQDGGGDGRALRQRGASFEGAEAELEAERPRIGLVIPFIGDYFAIRLLSGIRDALAAAGYSLLALFTFNDKEREEELIRELRDTVEGLIIFPVDANVYNEEIIALKMNGYPFVLIDRYLPGVETHTVNADGALAAKLAVDHLWALGHRSIAICADTPLSTASVDDRVNGYMNALKENGGMINPALLLTDFTVEPGEAGPEHPLVRTIASRAATAYIALNSTLGLHIAALAKEAGLEVPRDLSILTFDNPSRGLLDEQGTFTYIDQHEGGIGRSAGELILDIVGKRRKSAEAYSHIVLKPELVVRGTTGPAPEPR